MRKDVDRSWHEVRRRGATRRLGGVSRQSSMLVLELLAATSLGSWAEHRRLESGFSNEALLQYQTAARLSPKALIE